MGKIIEFTTSLKAEVKTLGTGIADSIDTINGSGTETQKAAAEAVIYTNVRKLSGIVEGWK
jgi:hypothetical protein